MLKLIHSYQAATPGSRAFKTRLIELVAVAVHRVGVWIYQLDTSVHKGDALATWKPEEGKELSWLRRCPDGAPPTFFFHRWYKDYGQYPDGIADGVGYWAESRILGGVVLFNRRSPDIRESDGVFLHPGRWDVAYRICRLLGSQKQLLLDFLLHDDESAPSPLPILCDQGNRERVDPEQPILESGVYRDRWERKEIPVSRADCRLKDTFTKLDWLSADEKVASARRAKRKRYQQTYREE